MYDFETKTIDGLKYTRDFYICDGCCNEISVSNELEMVFVDIQSGTHEVRKHFHKYCCPKEILNILLKETCG